MATYYANSGRGTFIQYVARTWTVGELMVTTFQVTATGTNEAVARPWVWECTTGGTTTSTPTTIVWPATVAENNVFTVDGTAQFTAKKPDSWAKAHQSPWWLIGNATTATYVVGGDVIKVASTHDYTYPAAGSTCNLGFSPTSGIPVTVISCNTSTGLYQFGARETMTSARNYSINGLTTVYGLTVRVGGATASNASVNFLQSNTADENVRLVNCLFYLNNTGTGSSFAINSGDITARQLCLFDGCTFQFGSTSQGIVAAGANAVTEFRNCTTTGSSPTNVFRASSARGCGTVYFHSCDFSNASALVSGSSNPTKITSWIGVNSKVPSTILTTLSGLLPGTFIVDLQQCGTADNAYGYYYFNGIGEVVSDVGVYLTTGASQLKNFDGSSVSYSFKADPSTLVNAGFPLCTPWVSKFVGSTGSKTISLKIAYDAATALTDMECWIEVEYLGDATTPMSTVAISAPVISGTNGYDPTATPTSLTNTSEAWTGTSGWTNKKTATLSKTVTINQQGYVRARVAVAKDVTVYVDGKIAVS